MFSMPPAMTHSASPVRIDWAASATALRPEPQALFTPKLGTSFGTPPLRAATRAAFSPRFAARTLPRITSSTDAGSIPARLIASAIARPPSSGAGLSANAPWKLPMAVRVALTMTALLLTTWSSCFLPCGSLTMPPAPGSTVIALPTFCIRASGAGVDVRTNPVDDVLGARSGREDFLDPERLELGDVLLRHDAAAEDRNVAHALFLHQRKNAREQCHVRARKNGQAHAVDVFLDGGLGDHLRRLVETRIDDLEAGIAQRARDDLRAAVVAVEAGFCHQNSQNLVGHNRFPLSAVARSPPVAMPRSTVVVMPAAQSAGAFSNRRGILVDAEDFAIDVRNLADGHAFAHGFDDRRHQVAVLARRAAHGFDALGDFLRIAARLEGRDFLALLLLEAAVDAQDLERLAVFHRVAVDADGDVLVFVDRLLECVCGVGDLGLRIADLDRAHDAAEIVDAADVLLGLALHAVGERFDRIAAAERVDGVHDAAFLGEDLLRAQRDGDRLFRRKRERFVERIGVQRLHSGQNRGQRLHGDANDVVERLLRGQRNSRRLRVRAHQAGAVGLGAEALAHDARPQAPRRADLGDLFEEVVVDVEEERQARSEVVRVKPALDGRVDVTDPVGERERELLDRRRAGFADMVAADRYRMPLRRFLHAELDHVGHDPQRRLGRTDPFLLRDELLEHVVLDGAARSEEH